MERQCWLLTEVHSNKQNEEAAATWIPVRGFRPGGTPGCVPVSMFSYESDTPV